LDDALTPASETRMTQAAVVGTSVPGSELLGARAICRDFRAQCSLPDCMD